MCKGSTYSPESAPCFKGVGAVVPKQNDIEREIITQLPRSKGALISGERVSGFLGLFHWSNNENKAKEVTLVTIENDRNQL